MNAAMKRAGIAASDIDYINAHGTSTQIGDEIELGAVERLLGNAASKVSMSSTKSSTGHLLGAAGAIEAIFSILAIRDNIAPPTINLDNPSVETAIDLVPHTPRKREINVALSNSFGFGGTNASVVLQRVVQLDASFLERSTVSPYSAITPSVGVAIGTARICRATIEPTGFQVASMSERPPISPRSPRAALEPEQVPPPPKRSGARPQPVCHRRQCHHHHLAGLR